MDKRANLEADGRRDKKTEKTSLRLSYQLEHSIAEFARRNGIESLQAAMRKLMMLGLAVDEHVLHCNFAKYSVEPLSEDKDS